VAGWSRLAYERGLFLFVDVVVAAVAAAVVVVSCSYFFSWLIPLPPPPFRFCFLFAFLSDSSWDEIAGLRSDMATKGIIPDTYTYNTLLVALARAAEDLGRDGGGRMGNVEEVLLLDSPRECYRRAEEIWEEMRERGSVVPDGHTYCSLVRTCVAADEGERALHFFHRMLDDHTNMLEEAGGGGRGSGVKRREKVDGRRMTVESIEIARNVIAAHVGQPESDNVLAEHESAVLSLVSSSPSSSLQDASRVFSSLCRGVCLRGRSEVATSWCVDALKSVGHTLHDVVVHERRTCNALLQALCDVGEVEQAMRLLDEMEMAKAEPDVVSYNHLLTGMGKRMMDLSKGGERGRGSRGEEKGERGVGRATESGTTENSVKITTSRAHRSSEMRRSLVIARRVFDDMRKQHCRWNSPSWMSDVNDVMPISTTVVNGWRKYPGGLSRGYGAIMMACKAARDSVAAEEYFVQMVEDEDMPTHNNATDDSNKMGWQTSGVDERALRTVLPLLRATVGAEKYQKLTRKHEPSLARIVTTATESGTTTIRQNIQYSRMIRRACEKGEWSRAKILFEQMSLDGIPRNSVVWTTMVQGAFDVGKYGHALSMFERMGREGVRDTAACRLVLQRVLSIKGDIQMVCLFYFNFF